MLSLGSYLDFKLRREMCLKISHEICERISGCVVGRSSAEGAERQELLMGLGLWASVPGWHLNTERAVTFPMCPNRWQPIPEVSLCT